jgi:hypothetical protein
MNPRISTVTAIATIMITTTMDPPTLRYLPEPQKDPIFAVYFKPQWKDQLCLSLTNFLSLIFRATPLPKLLLLQKWHRWVGGAPF